MKSKYREDGKTRKNILLLLRMFLLLFLLWLSSTFLSSWLGQIKAKITKSWTSSTPSPAPPAPTSPSHTPPHSTSYIPSPLPARHQRFPVSCAQVTYPGRKSLLSLIDWKHVTVYLLLRRFSAQTLFSFLFFSKCRAKQSKWVRETEWGNGKHRNCHWVCVTDVARGSRTLPHAGAVFSLLTLFSRDFTWCLAQTQIGRTDHSCG